MLGQKQERILRTAKCWQGVAPFLVWQLSPGPSGEKLMLPKKFFLLIDCQQAKRGIKLCLEKPSALQQAGGLSSLLRKHLSQGVIKHVLRHKSLQDLWLPIYSNSDALQSPHWYFHLSAEKPPELNFLSYQGESFFRFGQKGSFTKKKALGVGLPQNWRDDPEWEDLLPAMIADLMGDSSKEALTPSLQKLEVFSPQSEMSDFQKEAKRKFARRIKTLRQALEKQRSAIPQAAELQELQLKAQHLQANAYRVKAGMYSLVLEEAITGLTQALEISLDPERSVGQNVEQYFIQLKKRRKAEAIGKRRLEESEKELAAMEAHWRRLTTACLSEQEVSQLLVSHHLVKGTPMTFAPARSQKLESSEGKPYRLYKGPGKVRYLVGKGPRENDELTKAAAANDYWLHVIGSPGSHVVLPYKSLKEEGLSPQVKKEAAILALHFSKNRQEHAGEVYITQKHYLKKKKGLPPGLWLVDKSETFFVRYSPEELESILNRPLES